VVHAVHVVSIASGAGGSSMSCEVLRRRRGLAGIFDGTRCTSYREATPS